MKEIKGERSRNTAKRSSRIIDETEGDIQHRKETKEDDYINYNIHQISKVGDLSPRHTNTLKAKIGRSTIPLQVKTRSSKDKYSNSDQ